MKDLRGAIFSRLLGFEPLEARRMLTMVTVLDPPAESHVAPISTNITVDFVSGIAANSVDDQSFVVHARQSGRLLTANADIGRLPLQPRTIRLSPNNNFHAGELVQGTVTSAMQGIGGGGAVTSHVWQFRAAPSGGSGLFTDTQQMLASSQSQDVELGDLDGDGDLDAFVANIGTFPAVTSRVWGNIGGGIFRAPPQCLSDTQRLARL